MIIKMTITTTTTMIFVEQHTPLCWVTITSNNHASDKAHWLWYCHCAKRNIGYPAEVGALFTTVGLSSIRVSRVSVMVSVRDSVK